jgi:hypothetical protein
MINLFPENVIVKENLKFHLENLPNKKFGASVRPMEEPSSVSPSAHYGGQAGSYYQ